MDRISIGDHFINNRFTIDVRSPIEFNHGHIPHAKNLPLFTDEERKIVGTTYKKLGKRLAVEKGLELVSFPRIIQEIRKLELPHSVTLYCARGGMRSASMAWLLELLGYEVFTIDGGYKSFRKLVRDQFCHVFNLCVLGGETGSGKTKLLKALENGGENVIDLEGLAHHRGSVFGGMDDQPTQETFENRLAIDLFSMRDGFIWIEDESERIGSLTIPRSFFQQIRSAQMIVLQVAQETRIQECLNEYLPIGSQKLSGAIHRLQKRLGGLETKKALDALERSDFIACCEILLRYYDKKYRYAISQKSQEKLLFLPIENKSLEETLLKLKSLPGIRGSI
jgi:tRNA 2-selenouridine synthase